MKKCKFVVFFIIMAIIVGIIGFNVVANLIDVEYTVKVSRKVQLGSIESIGETLSDKRYSMIYGVDDNKNYYELKNADSILRGKFNSLDYFDQIEIGKTYIFTVTGYRQPWFDQYQNIISFREADI